MPADDGAPPRSESLMQGRPCLAALAALIWLGGCMPEPHSDNAPIARAASATPRAEMPRRLFISGHSLTAPPFPDDLAALAVAEGNQLEWNMQHLAGSSLRMRTQDSYSVGTDRNGKPISVLDEISPRNDAAPYDTLILTEIHTLLESLLWNDTVGNALDYVARFTQSNPAAHVYLYTAWLDVDDMDDPRRWISYERAAAQAWQCTASRVNQELASRGNAQRVQIIPAAEALAALVEEVASGQSPAFDDVTARGAIRQLFTDSVHLTELGSYYVALVTYAVLYGSIPEAPWAPEIDPGKARGLQDSARRFMAGWSQPRTMTSAECSDYLADQFASIYLGYVRDTKWRDEGWLRARYRWARYSIEWPTMLRSNSERNPFRENSTVP